MPTRTKGVRTIRAFSVLIMLWGLLAQSALADPAPVIARIERLPRKERLRAYEVALADRSLPPADRPALVKAFARHAQQVSPLYGKSDFLWNEARWMEILLQGFDARKPDADVALALAQIYIDAKNPRAASPVVSAFKAAFPGHHHALAWSEWCALAEQEKGSPGSRELLTFPVHFCILTRNPAAHRVATLEQCRKECDILNSTFRTLDGAPLVRFEFKSFSAYQDVKDVQTELLRYGDSAEFDSARVAKAFNTCTDPRVRDPRAINVYIFDSYSARPGSEDVTSHGKRNSNRPYVFLDWQRLDNKIQNAEAHEMGHAFGLEHVGVPGATAKTSTNIMASAAEGFGSGGLRDLGFTPAQSALIRYHARRTRSRLGLAR
jgi:hypothetical protein